MPRTEAQKRARNKWQAKAMRQIALRFNRENDADVLRKMDSVPNKTDYVRQLVRDDIGKEEENGQAICDTGQ